MTDTKRIPFKLDYPITVNGQEVSDITLRRARVKDLEAMQSEKTDFAKTKFMIVQLSGLTPKELDQMDAADYSRLGDEVVGFLG